ncbi:MAG: exo-alpha-sialidase [Flavobacteriales bacterium]|nr:exo-alpha-sialidase [Flavobacteriales bacterium]
MLNLRINWLFICLVLLTTAMEAQSRFPNVRIDAQESHFTYPTCEPSIAISRKHPGVMVAGSILNNVYVSEDGGQSWEKDQLESKYGVFGDPCVVAGAKGDFYYLHLSDPKGLNRGSDAWLDRIVCQRSRDKGDNWSDGASIGLNGTADQDKEWAVVAPSGKRIYTTWTQFDKYDSREPGDSTLILFSCSNRRAQRWSKPVRISAKAGDCVDDDQTVEGAVPAVGPNGEIYVAWALNSDIWFDKSTDGGKTWREQDIRAGSIVAGWSQDIPGISRCNGMPVTDCDLSSGPHRGTIYINYTDQVNGENDTDVFLIKSNDGGDSWSDPIKVNQDDSGRHQFFTWMVVDQATGYLYFVYYDRQHYSDNRTDVSLAVSRDGGATFETEIISESPFVPIEEAFFGDYNDIDAYQGVVRPIWTRQDKGLASVWTALIEINE